MAIKFFCPSGHRLSAPDGHVGRKIRCPACRQATIVPERSAETFAASASDDATAKPSASDPTAEETPKPASQPKPEPARKKSPPPPPVKPVKAAKEAEPAAGPRADNTADAPAGEAKPEAAPGKAPPPALPKAKSRPPKRSQPKPPPPPPPAPKAKAAEKSTEKSAAEPATDEATSLKPPPSESPKAKSAASESPPPRPEASSEEPPADGSRRRGRRGRRRRDRQPETPEKEKEKEKEKQPEAKQEPEAKAPKKPRQPGRFGRAKVMGPHVYRPDRGRLQSLQWLAAILGLVMLFSVAPAVGLGYLSIESAPGWARLVLAMAAVQLVFVVWMLATPDWASVWVVMVVFGCVSTIYAVGTSLVLATPLDQTMPLGLGQIRRWAGHWFGAVLAVQCLGTYLCGRTSTRWHRMFQLEIAGRGKREGVKG